MPDTQQILTSIETRLDEAHAEIASLTSAVAALSGSSSAPYPQSPKRQVRRKRADTTPMTGERASATPADREPAKAVRPAKRVRSRELQGGVIEELLRAAAGGLSAAALIKQTGAAQA